MRPYLGLAEQLGRAIGAICEGLPSRLEVACSGALAEEDTSILTLSLLKGLLASGTDEPVSYVNAPRLAEERGLQLVETSTHHTREYVSLISAGAGDHAIAGTLAGPRLAPRIVMIDDHEVELPFAEHLLVVRNDDRPGMVGLVGSSLGEAGISITNMAVGQTEGGGTALMVLSTDRQVPRDVVGSLRSQPGILAVTGW